jgi:hypothetical protein
LMTVGVIFRTYALPAWIVNAAVLCYITIHHDHYYEYYT